MNTRNKLLATGSVMVALTAFTPHFQHAHANTDTFNASGTVVDALGMAETTPLKFGKFSSTGSGKVTVSPASAQSVTGSNIALGGGPQAGVFKVTVPASSSIVLSVVGLTATNIALKGATTTSQQLEITSLKFTSPGAMTQPGASFTLDTADANTNFKITGTTKETITYGATATIPATTSSQVYSGTFNLSLSFP